MDKILFDNWSSILRTIIIGITAYSCLILLLRISGKRTLSKMNSFDLIVTIALGSTLATVLLNKNVALADGILAFALLIYLQFSITWLSARSDMVKKIIKPQPALLFYRGKFIDKAMKEERITEEEVLAKIRESGMDTVEEIGAVVLETDGGMSIIKNIKNPSTTILSNVKKPTMIS